MQLFYDVIVVGAGHAGCEAACASAQLGAHTCLVTMDMNKIGQMSCNPAVGGIAKGQIVREIDALGGRMGIVTDQSAIQFRMLNRSKGPAMWSPRAQCDRERFIWNWRHQLDLTPNLDIWQDQVTELITTETPGNTGNTGKTGTTGTTGHAVTGVRTIWGCELYAPCVVITAGTFLNGLMHIGRRTLPGGRIAEPAALHLTESINALGIRSARMKTGTPVRIDRRSVDFSLMERQPGEGRSHFSYLPPEHVFNTERPGNSEMQASTATPRGPLPDRDCWTTATNEECHRVLLSGLADSPLYNGQIQSIGPRYCPSVETKLMTFPDRTSHPLFLEPEGTDTNEMYLNGFSSSMPMDVQLRALRCIPAFRNLRIYRPGYAIEYDFFDPTQLTHSLESKLCRGLFFAGQVNGTTGYEEAAGQGIIAGINAAIRAGQHATAASCKAEAAAAALTPATAALTAAAGDGLIPCGAPHGSFILHRDEAYIGVLIDDLVMKGVDAPYRMFTSRAEYRILLRQDDADRRLTPRAHAIGLATTDRYNHWLRKEAAINELTARLRNTLVRQDDINPYLTAIGSTPVNGSVRLHDILTRPGVTIAGLQHHALLNITTPAITTPACPISDNNLTPTTTTPACPISDPEVTEATEIMIKYDGYIRREREYADKMHRLEDIKIPDGFDYNRLQSLSTEARQKLTARQPHTIAQASRIPGVSPSDVNVLLVFLGR